MKPATSSSRLQALDLLRGLDMLLLTVVGPLVWAADRVWGLPKTLCAQFTHASWVGFTLWDWIMPLFIFMCGAAIPFALPKHQSGKHAGWHFWRHVLGRVLLLWLLGMAIQGHLLTLRPDRIVFFNNTLQAIAVGYLIAALTWLVPWRSLRVAMPLLLAGAYSLLLAIDGNYTPSGNLAIRIEHLCFPNNGDGYGWTLTSLMFGAMTLCGMHCTALLRREASSWRKLIDLGLFGGALLGGGLLAELWIPPIKRIYTLSFTAQAMGWSILALAALYLIADVFKLARCFGLVSLFGHHALMAYLCGTFFAPLFETAARLLTQGAPYWLGAKVQPFVLASAQALLLILVLAAYDARRTHPRA